MRIISQNGTIDVPYEMIALHNSDGMILMNMVGDTGKGSVMAKYSSSKVAEKAMEEIYSNRCYTEVFRFPKEDEL